MALKNLFTSFFSSGRNDSASQTNPDECVEYKDFSISPTPIAEGSQFRTAGTISRVVEGTRKESKFIRADNHSSREHAVEHAISKARQIIDEQSNRLLDSEHC